jgi:hypothetical protein
MRVRLQRSEPLRALRCEGDISSSGEPTMNRKRINGLYKESAMPLTIYQQHLPRAFESISYTTRYLTFYQTIEPPLAHRRHHIIPSKAIPFVHQQTIRPSCLQNKPSPFSAQLVDALVVPSPAPSARATTAQRVRTSHSHLTLPPSHHHTVD